MGHPSGSQRTESGEATQEKSSDPCPHTPVQIGCCLPGCENNAEYAYCMVCLCNARFIHLPNMFHA